MFWQNTTSFVRIDVSGNPHGEHESTCIQTWCEQKDEDKSFLLATGLQLFI